MGSDVTEAPKKIRREITRPLGQAASEFRRSGIPGVSEAGRVVEKGLGEVRRIDDKVATETTRVARSPAGQAAITAGAFAVPGVGPALGTAAVAGFAAQNAKRAGRADLLPATQQTRSLPTRIQSETRSALADLRQRLRQAGSRSSSNRGIGQLNPLPQIGAPQLSGNLG